MPKKNDQSGSEEGADEQMLKAAQRELAARKTPQCVCVVCGSEAASTLTDDELLCWVCRRLKISAWRETDSQVPLQE